MSEDIVLVTGASSDVGAALVRNLAHTKAIVIAHYHRNADPILNINEQVGNTARIVPIQADLCLEPDVDRLIARVAEIGQPTRIIHLPAMGLRLSRFTDFDWGHLESDLHLQVRSIAAILKAFLPKMAKADRRGKVVFMLSSVTLGVPPKMMAPYILVKSALQGLMRALAVDYGDRNVNINAVAPYTIETKFLADVPAKYVEIAAASNPSKRNARVQDVIAAIEFLMSEGSDFLSGVNLPVAGGSVF